MFKTMILIFATLLSFGTAYALDATSAVVGYAVGKSGSGGRTVINGGNAVMGVLPFECSLDSNLCLYASPDNKHVPVKDVCSMIGPNYKPVGFKKVGESRGSVIVLCKEVKTGCAKCH